MDWNIDLAYAVGVITTDGYLSSDKRHISITSTDTQLLETLKYCLNKKNSIILNPISKLSKKTAYRLQFGDVKLYRWLESIGLHTNKSLTVGPLEIKAEFFRDFLRGHLDGDGSIITYEDRYLSSKNPSYVYQRLFVYFISSSKLHVYWLSEVINNLTGLKGSISRIVSKTKLGSSDLHRLKFSTKEAKMILNWIYYEPGLPCLIRKYKIAKPFIQE